MKQDDINEMEWRNPANWTWRGPLGLYSSKRDTRLIVPKAMPMSALSFALARTAAHRRLIGCQQDRIVN